MIQTSSEIPPSVPYPNVPPKNFLNIHLQLHLFYSCVLCAFYFEQINDEINDDELSE